MLIVLFVLLTLVALIYLFLQEPQFGKAATGQRLERINNSPNYKNGQFQNLSDTPQLTEGATYTGVMREFLFWTEQKSDTD